MSNDISDKDKRDWDKFVAGNEKLYNKDLKYQEKKILKTKSIDLILKFFLISLLRSLFGNLSLLLTNLSQSFLSLSEISLLNYVNILTSCQLGLVVVTSREKTQVS